MKLTQRYEDFCPTFSIKLCILFCSSCDSLSFKIRFYFIDQRVLGWNWQEEVEGALCLPVWRTVDRVHLEQHQETQRQHHVRLRVISGAGGAQVQRQVLHQTHQHHGQGGRGGQGRDQELIRAVSSWPTEGDIQGWEPRGETSMDGLFGWELNN